MCIRDSCKFEADKPASGGGSSSSGGSSASGSGSASTPDSSVDLSAFYSTVTTNHQFGMLSLADATMIKDEMCIRDRYLLSALL